ncbi:hypothetical protein Tco_0534086 [Tanacetum coccineum]
MMRKKSAQKDLEVHQTVNTVVEIVFGAESSSFHENAKWCILEASRKINRKAEEEKLLFVRATPMMAKFSGGVLCREEYVTLRKVGDASHKGVAEYYIGIGVDCGCVAGVEAVACLDDVWNLDNLLVVDPIDPATIMTQE